MIINNEEQCGSSYLCTIQIKSIQSLMFRSSFLISKVFCHYLCSYAYFACRAFYFPFHIVEFGLILKFKGEIAGPKRLQKSKVLKKLLKEQDAAGRIYGAVCSSPAVLHSQGLLKVIEIN